MWKKQLSDTPIWSDLVNLMIIKINNLQMDVLQIRIFQLPDFSVVAMLENSKVIYLEEVQFGEG